MKKIKRIVAAAIAFSAFSGMSAVLAMRFQNLGVGIACATFICAISTLAYAIVDWLLE